MEKGGGPWTLGAIDFKPSLPKNSSSSIADFRYVFDIHTRVRSKSEFQIELSNTTYVLGSSSIWMCRISNFEY